MKQYAVQNKQGKAVSITCQTLDPLSAQFSEHLRSISTLLTKAYVPVESQFAKQFPDSLAQDKLLYPIAPLFKEGLHAAKWPVVEEQIETLLAQFLGDTFSKSLSVNKDVCTHFKHFLIVAKDRDQIPLGGLYGMMHHTDPASTVRVPIFGVHPQCQAQGIGKLLMNGILQYLPNCKKISLSTRITNDKAIKTYLKWGFVPVDNNVPHWANFEFLPEEPRVLC